ncbi:MAG: MerR family transcriptional regulator [Chloroflexota bacterium]
MALPQREPTFNLKVVLSETGVKAHTVRAWEKKYGLPKPTRSKGGHRVYTQHDISIVKWLMARLEEGMTIRRAAELWQSMEEKGGDPLDYVGYQVDELNTIFEKGQTLGEIRQAWINSCLKFDDASAEKYLTQAFALYPIKMVCLEILQKSMVQVGDHWFENKATAQQELFTSAKAIKRLSALLAGAPNPTRLGRLLVACPPGEEHVFSILLLSLLLRYQGWNVVYLGPNLPLAQLETTINAIEPNVVILAAQRLETAASLSKVTHLLAQMDVTSAFGGSIFNLIPSLRNHISGHFLGETIEGAVQVINKIMTFEPPMHIASPLPKKYEVALKHYDSRQYLIDFDTRQALEKENIPFAHLEDTNDRLKKSILAALHLGDIDYIDPELALAQQLMNNYGIPREMQTKYLRAYHASSKIRLGADGQIVTDWLDKLEKASYSAFN